MVCTSAHTVAAAAALAVPGLDLAKMEPLGDRLLVKPDEEPTTTDSGIIISTKASTPSMSLSDALIGEVVAVGSQVDIKVKKGDKIVYSKYSTSDVSVPEGDVTFVAQKSVLATLS
jgi:chaperonin GroES